MRYLFCSYDIEKLRTLCTTHISVGRYGYSLYGINDTEICFSYKSLGLVHQNIFNNLPAGYFILTVDSVPFYAFTARGLLHLHSNKIIHGDIKSGNILLDKHFEPKIGDFGLARGGPESDSMSYILASSLQGTMSYLPDDYCRSRQLTEQVDTFCYGILLFELVRIIIYVILA